MSKFTRACSLVLAAIVLISLLNGCGKKQEAANGPSTPTKKETQKPQQPEVKPSPDVKPAIELSGFYYYNGDPDYMFVNIIDDVLAEMYDPEYDEVFDWDYKIDSKNRTLTLYDSEATYVFDILDEDTIRNSDTGELYSRVIYAPVESYSVFGEYYMNGDRESWCLSFDSDTLMWMYDPDIGWEEYEYIVDADMVRVEDGDQGLFFYILDEDTLESYGGNYFYRADPEEEYSEPLFETEFTDTFDFWNRKVLIPVNDDIMVALMGDSSAVAAISDNIVVSKDSTDIGDNSYAGLFISGYTQNSRALSALCSMNETPFADYSDYEHLEDGDTTISGQAAYTTLFQYRDADGYLFKAREFAFKATNGYTYVLHLVWNEDLMREGEKDLMYNVANNLQFYK